MTSVVTFEATLSKNNAVPGDFDLGEIMGLPVGVKRDRATRGIALDRPADVSFRIVSYPAEPVSRVTSWELGYRLAPRHP